MRESLMKCVPLNGVPMVLEAIFAIAKVERPEDRDYSFSRHAFYGRTILRKH
jgi:hypothetical protein